jgi:hypothetical protein
LIWSVLILFQKIEDFVAKQGKRTRRKNSDDFNEAPVREQRNFTQDDESKR